MAGSVDIGASAQVVNWIKDGVSFPQVKELERKFFGENRITDVEEVAWTDGEIARLCETGALVEVGEEELLAVSPIRLAPKKGPKRFRLIVNMRGVNRSLQGPHFPHGGPGHGPPAATTRGFHAKVGSPRGVLSRAAGEQGQQAVRDQVEREVVPVHRPPVRVLPVSDHLHKGGQRDGQAIEEERN